MSDNDFVNQAVARAKQIAAKLGAGGDAPAAPSFSNNGISDEPSYSVSAAPVLGIKRAAPEPIINPPLEKKPMVTDKLTAAVEAASKINEKLGGSTYGNSNPLANQVLTLVHKIPDKYVGLVIGKKGEQIIQLQADSQCKVVISQEGGTPERELTMTGTQSQIDKAKSLINEIVERAGGTVSGGASGTMCSIDVMIPGLKAGLIIGKNGETIKQLQDNTGAKMVLIQESNTPTADDKPLRITGDSESVEKAKNMVIGMLANKDGKAMPRPQITPQTENADLCVYAVPTEKAGLVIGKGGETIREICARSGSFVEISKQQAADPGLKLFNIKGMRHEIDAAIRFISERAGIPVGPPQSYTPGGAGAPSASPMGPYSGQSQYPGAGGGPYHHPQHGQPAQWPGYGGPQHQGWAGNQGGHHPQQQAAAGQAGTMPPPSVNPSTGQPDYSAAWAEYYRRQGMHEYADMILRQAHQTNPSFQAPANGAAPAQSHQPQPQPQQPQPQQPQYDYGAQWHQWQQWQQQQATSGAATTANSHPPNVSAPAMNSTSHTHPSAPR